MVWIIPGDLPRIVEASMVPLRWTKCKDPKTGSLKLLSATSYRVQPWRDGEARTADGRHGSDIDRKGSIQRINQSMATNSFNSERKREHTVVRMLQCRKIYASYVVTRPKSQSSRMLNKRSTIEQARISPTLPLHSVHRHRH